MQHREGFAFGLLFLLVAATSVSAQTAVPGTTVIRPLPQPTPGWETKISNPSDPNYFAPAYPIAFVKVPVVEYDVQVCDTGYPPYNCSSDIQNCNPANIVTAKDSNYHLGTDVLSINDPDPGAELWIYLPANGQVKKLFPRPVHEQTGVIDFLAASGSVVEPNVSEDGTRIYFSYYQDATVAHSTQEYQANIPWSGADIYAIEIGPLLANPLTNPDTLTVTRLTDRVYSPSNPYKQLPADRDKDAMNPNLATSSTWDKKEYGTVYLHPVEVRTRNGLYLAYVSNKRRLDNSNQPMVRQNFNFNLHFAPILPDGTLGPEDNQFQYYTTTSALSPSPLRQGLAFSYQASTEDARNWHIQGMDSEGRWFPLIGYGSNPELFHLGTFCTTGSQDYFVASKYYNLNNEGYGSLWRQDLSILGKNTYHNAVQSSWKVPLQAGSLELTNPPGTSLSADYPSEKNPATGEYWGKFTAPRCGGANQLYFTYTPTSANGRLYDDECNKNIYHGYIGYRPNFNAWTPGESVANNGHHVVIRRTNDDSNLVWAVPVVAWSVRSAGDATQQVAPTSVISQTPHIEPGEPFALIGTSALWNTDRRPFECRFVQPPTGQPKWYTPWGTMNVNQENDLIADNQDGWTYVDNPGPGNNFCQFPDPSRILGIAVNVTSNKSNLSYYFGYTSQKEAARLIGVYDVRNQGDQSFQARIPANVPFELQALDTLYGMKLTDVRSWHSLKASEVRTDCGGCHQHEVNMAAIPFAGTYADTNPPLDMVASTPSISYTPNCAVQVDPPDTAPAEDYPEWRADIWPAMNGFCGSCHNSTTGNGTGNAALAWPDTSQTSGDNVYNAILNRRFASSQRGALGSQVFWAARGQRTDNRDNAANPANYSCTSGCTDKQRWGFYYSAAHNALAANCTNAVPGYADWVFDLGKWIDNHTPRDTGYAMGYKFDWYHPTADFALASASCATTDLRIGWWDDTNQIKSIKTWVNDNATPLWSRVWPNPSNPLINGKATIALPALSNSDWITVEVRDAVDNRQVYRKRVEQLVDDCVPSP